MEEAQVEDKVVAVEELINEERAVAGEEEVVVDRKEYAFIPYRCPYFKNKRLAKSILRCALGLDCELRQRPSLGFCLQVPFPSRSNFV
jgi:hypothetical protein